MYEVDQYTVSLLHFDDEIKDETGKIWKENGGAAVSTGQSKFGESSLSLNGVQYLFLPNNGEFTFGTGDFTVDCWIKRNDYSNSFQSMLSVSSDNAGAGNAVGYGFGLGLGTDLKGAFTITNNNISSSSSIATVSGKTVIPVGEWVHIAGVRHKNNLYFFMNGILENTGDCTGYNVNPNPATLVNVGTYANRFWPNNAFSGYIDELRVSNIARWISDFEPKVGRALLVVTMSDEIQKEYELSIDQINAFITWYNTRATGSGLPHYTFNKDFNLGPFQGRKDYLVFDKIQNFEVMEY